MTGLFRQAIKFGAVGVVNTAIGLSLIYAAMYFFRLSPGLANAVGYGVGLVVSFQLNRFWTFRENSGPRRFLGQYVVAAGVAYLGNLGIVLIGTSVWHLNPYLVQLAGMGCYTVLMFCGCKWWVFRA